MRPTLAGSLTLGLVACRPGGVSGVSVSVSPTVGTTVRLSWTAAGATGATVAFGTDGMLDDSVTARTWRSRSGREMGQEALLWGLLPSTEYAWRITTTIDGQPADTREGTFTTGDVPPGLPTVTIDAPDPGAVASGFVATALVPANAPVILDKRGRYRWWFVDEGNEGSIIRVRLALDGRHVLYNFGNAADPEIVRVSLDGSEVQRIKVPGHRHDFVELPDGTLGCIVSDIRIVDGAQVEGTDLVEVAPDGTQTPIWSAWDSLSFDPDVVDGQGTWTHGNALDYDPDAEVYRLSLRNLNTILTISRTGAIVGAVGGTDSDYTFTAGSEPFVHQHQFEFLGDHLLVFDNGPDDELSSRAVEYALNEAAGTADSVWEYEPDPPVFEVALGDVARLGNGNTLVAFSLLGRIDEVAPEGTLTWRLSTSLGGSLGYVVVLGDLDGHL